MNPYKLRISRELHGALRDLADSHAMDVSEVVRRFLRQWRKAMPGIGWTKLREPATRDASTVLEIDIPPHLRVGLGCQDVCAIIAWGMSRPCNQPQPRIPFDLEDGRYVLEDESNGE
jgi:hypothetical protein